MLPGFRLRQVRERLGLTYRDVERASFELAARRGRPEFVFGGFVEFVCRRVDPLPKLIGKRRYIRNPGCVWS